MDNVKFFDEKKYMWDGRSQSSEGEAIQIQAEYEKNDFETRMIREGEEYFLFTRKVITEFEVDEK